MLRSAQFISINFEDLNFSHLQTAKSLHDEITTRAAEINGKVYLFFDEIQEVKDWEKCINSLRVSLDCDIYITGSNAKLLSGELSAYLGGRFVEFVIYPFSFAEFLELYRPIASETRKSTLYVTRATLATANVALFVRRSFTAPFMVSQRGFEPPTPALGERCSVP